MKDGGEGAVTVSDACCQTQITIPMSFDLGALLRDHGLSEFVEGADGVKDDLMVSSLRRKLFEQDNNNTMHSPPISSRKTNVCITSSPRRNAAGACCSSADSSLRSLMDAQAVSPVQAGDKLSR